MVRWHTRPSAWQATLFAGALAAMLVPGAVRAAGLLDFLFGGPDERRPPPVVESYAEPAPPVVAPVPLGPERVRQSGGSTGHVVAFCVRLCDGQHFPLEHLTNGTPVETCRAMCPASRTKVFFGSEIGGAVAKDGARYADLDNAFIYRKQLVANCTCNGKDAFGLAPFDMASDPTLRPGDIVATKQGLLAYTGRSGAAAQFTPVKPSRVASELNAATAPAAGRLVEPAVDEDPGTIALPPRTSPVALGANLRAQSVR